MNNKSTFEERLEARLKQMDEDPKSIKELSEEQRMRNNEAARVKYAQRTQEQKEKDKQRYRDRYREKHPDMTPYKRCPLYRQGL